MATQWISPTWRMPENSNQSKVDNYSLDFDGSSQYIDLGTQPIVTGIFSISMWIKRNSTSVGDSVQIIIGKDGSSSNRVFNVYFQNIGGSISFWVSSTGAYSINYRVDTSTLIDDTNWHHIVLINNGDSVNNQIFIDGVEASYASQKPGRSTLYDDETVITSIGGDSSTGTTYNFNGKIGPVSMFDSALSVSQITALYNSGTPVNPMALTPLPTAYYPLGEGSTGSSTTLTVPNDSIPSATVFDFDGSTDFITVPGVSLGTTCTFSCWVNFDSFSLTTGIVFGETAGKYAIYAPNSTTISANFGPSFGAGGHAFTVPTMSTGVWYNIVLTKTGANGELFFNGQSQGTTTNFGSNSFTLNLLGCERQTGATRYYVDGKISNAAVWDSDQSANIVNIYNNGIPQSTYTTTPKAWWKMNVDASNWDLTSTSWSITKIGSPYYNGASDGAYAQNGVLRSQDTNSYTIASGDYFQWNSPTVYTSGSDIVLSSSGGEANGQTSGVEIIYQYNIDNTSWTTWHQHTDTGTTNQAYAVPSTSPLTVSSNIKIRVQLAGGPNNNSFVDVSDINITGGTSSYSEDFSNVTKYGWFGGSETANPTTTAWIITDSSGNKNTGTSSGMTTANLVTSDLTRSIPYSSYSMYMTGSTDDTYFDLGTDIVVGTSGNATYSWSIWVKPVHDGITDVVVFGDSGATDDGSLVLSHSGSTWTAKLEQTGTDLESSTGAIADNAWSHIAIVVDSTASTKKMYINGQEDTAAGGTGAGPDGTIKNINSSNTSNQYTGYVSNWAFWTSALSDDNILSIYNSGVPNSLTSLSPAHWWSMSGDSYYNGSAWTCPDLIGSNNLTGVNDSGQELIGDGPGSTANGVATSMDIPANLKGDAPNSTSNAFSINMNPLDRVEYDLEAKAFINAAGITDATQQLAIKILVSSLQSDNLWTNMKAIYPMVGGTATTHMYNLKDPQDTDAAFRLTFDGGWTHSATGALPNGTNGRANSHLVPNTDISSVDAMSYGYYSRDTSGANGLYDMGSYQAGAVSIMLIRFSNRFYYSINQTDYEKPASTATSGLFVANRSGAGAIEGYINGSVFDTGTDTSTSRSSNDMGVGGIYGTNGYGTRECAFAFIYDGSLDATQNSNLYNAVQAFNTTLSRQV